MDQAQIIDAITQRFAGLDIVTGEEGIAAGDTFFFYDPDRSLDPGQRWPFATIVTKDYGEFDNASQLDRPGVFRLNIGVSQETFKRLFGTPPRADTEAHGAGPIPSHDFTALDQLLPHPVYGPQSWVCVLSPSEATFQRLQPLLEEAYDRAVRRYQSTLSRARGAPPSP